MRCVVDSNYLQTDALRAYLQRSRQNEVVFTDYAFMEALKNNTLASVYKSLSVLKDFPGQVTVLKTTWHACGLHGGSKGLQRRLVDVPRTREFGIFCRALRNAEMGEPTMQQELLRLGREATVHLQSMESSALAFAQSSKDAAAMFTCEEQRQVREAASLSDALLTKLIQAAIWECEFLFANHPAVRRLPTRDELPNTYLFRSSLCHLLLVLKWAYDGGTSSNAERLRNDMVDTHFASYSSYFDDLLSHDRLARFIASRVRGALARIQALVTGR
jgi:hypothetical protein